MSAGDDVLRLLVLTDTAILGAGGSERFLRNLLTRLPAERYAIDVMQFAAEPDETARVARLEHPSIRLDYYPIGAVYGARGWSALRRLSAQVKHARYHIVQSQHEKSDLISALLPRAHCLRKISNRRDLGFQRSARVSALFRRLNGRFDCIVAPTQCIVDKVLREENAKPAKCRAIPNGVDTTVFRPVSPARRGELRMELGFASTDVLVGCVASFTPVKRHVDLLDAFAKVRAAQPLASLVLIGDGPLRGDIEDRIARLGLQDCVHLLGARRDVDRLLPALDMFVLASSTEGLSNAILEAQACSLAVVATDVGGNSDLVREGVNGFLVPALQPDALARALMGLASQPEAIRALGANARAQVERDHSLDAMAESYDRLYRELAHVG